MLKNYFALILKCHILVRALNLISECSKQKLFEDGVQNCVAPIPKVQVVWVNSPLSELFMSNLSQYAGYLLLVEEVDIMLCINLHVIMNTKTEGMAALVGGKFPNCQGMELPTVVPQGGKYFI